MLRAQICLSKVPFITFPSPPSLQPHIPYKGGPLADRYTWGEITPKG